MTKEEKNMARWTLHEANDFAPRYILDRASCLRSVCDFLKDILKSKEIELSKDTFKDREWQIRCWMNEEGYDISETMLIDLEMLVIDKL